MDTFAGPKTMEMKIEIRVEGPIDLQT
jgi:hypothetical protein